LRSTLVIFINFTTPKTLSFFSNFIFFS